MSKAVINGKNYNVQLLKEDGTGYSVKIIGTKFDGVIVWIEKSFISFDKTPVFAKFEYIVDKEEEYDTDRDRYVDKIRSRGVTITLRCADKFKLWRAAEIMYDTFSNNDFAMCDTFEDTPWEGKYSYIDSFIVSDKAAADESKKYNWKEFKDKLKTM